MPTPAPTKLEHIFSSPADISRKVDRSLINGLISRFPVEGRNFILTLSNVRAEPKEFTHEDEKEAILKSKSLTYPIKGDLTLIDKATGKVIDKQEGFPLMDSFWLSGKHTMVYKGNNYSVANQLQLRPGVYTRSRQNGELEAHLNTATGRSFSLTLDPVTGLFYAEINKTSSIPVAPLLTKVFGVGPSEVSHYIPAETWQANLEASAGKETKFLSDMYKRLVSTSKQVAGASQEEMAAQLKTSLESSQLSTQTTADTLGKSFTGVTGEVLLRAMRNLVEVHSGKRLEDNRDSLQFKRVQNLPDFLARRFDKEHKSVSNVNRRMAYELDRMDKNDPKIKGNIASKPFNKVFSNYVLESNLVSTPSETNPVESLENVAKVTVLGGGEGGIESDRGVPMAARDIDPSHLGLIDPSRTPESGHAGIDQRFTINAKRDEDGNLYARVRDKEGKVKHISVHEMMTSTIGFPHQGNKDKVQAQVKGEFAEVPRSKVDYWLADGTDMYTITTNLVPFLNSNHPGRLTMAGKAIPQALSLVEREAPLVQTVNGGGNSFVGSIGKVISTVAPVAGEVVNVTGKQVSIKDAEGKIVRVPFVKNLPFNMKGFLDDEAPLVKVGDHVKPGDILADNNYTRGGQLALGKNLNVAYLPYKGYNHEDGLVISESAAKGLSSHHAYKVDYDVQNTSVMKKSLINRYFPGRFTKEQLDKLDDKGFAKVGVTLNHGDPIYVVLEKREPTAEDKMLGRLHKTLVNPYRAVSDEWTNEENGEVVDAHTESKAIRLLVRSIKQLEVGDKLTGLHGNKGIVSLILPDHEMPFNKETGKPVDLLLNPASVTSRINLGQLMETAAAKIANKTGKPYMIHNFSKENNVVELKDELNKNGISDSEDMIDPKTGKELRNILTGPQYFLKLYKTTDQNWSARNVGGYDNTLQPTKGGEEGSKAVGYMEMLGLLGSNARKNLKEISTIKSQDNSEYWAKFMTGQPLPKPRTTFATEKFFQYLKGAGINPRIEDGKITASPLTDTDILAMSNGELQKPLMISAKDLEPEKGGLFDPGLTGGLRGNKWTHYPLAEALPNPVFEKPIKSLLGLKSTEYDGLIRGAFGIKKVKNGVFALHDTTTGKHIKNLEVNAGSITTEVEPEEAEELDDDSDES
jgi:DNA-directed RNA polymerase beta subunit